ncbi:MAG: family 16 glycosylhydrolase [Pseudomonadota bacterium]
MPNRPQSNGPRLNEAAFIDALILGVFSLQTALAVVALSTKPALQSALFDTSDDIQIVEALPDIVEADPETKPQKDALESSAIAPADPRAPPPLPESQRITSGPSFVTLFGDGHNASRWHVAAHSNDAHPFFGNDWSADSAVFSTDGLKLQMLGSEDRWLGGEVKTKAGYGYGRYEVVMKPAKSSGLVSAFFTYTGPYFGDPHDEIDIEFVGNDMRRVEFNYFKNGRTLNHKALDLPFDASEDFHIYAFEWYPDSIRWFIDNELVFQTPEGDTNIPRTPGSIHMNLWTGTLSGLKSWHGRPDFMSGIAADYGCVSFTSPGDGARRCSNLFTPPSATTGQFVGLTPEVSSTQIINTSAQ